MGTILPPLVMTSWIGSTSHQPSPARAAGAVATVAVAAAEVASAAPRVVLNVLRRVRAMLLFSCSKVWVLCNPGLDRALGDAQVLTATEYARHSHARCAFFTTDGPATSVQPNSDQRPDHTHRRVGLPPVKLEGFYH